jgi:ribonuclease HII
MNYEHMTVEHIKSHLNQLDIHDLEKELELLKSDRRKSVEKLVKTYYKRVQKHYHELERLSRLWDYENALYAKGFQYIAGVDEAGRGPLAGSVFAAAVILPKDVIIPGIDDSKKLSSKKREQLYDMITEQALDYSIVSISEQEIDRINIRHAAHKGMILAIQQLKIKPQYVLIDGEDIPNMPYKHAGIVKGDSLSISIGAASILAKVSRDRYIQKFDDIYPEYGFGKHKGYGTEEHIRAIKEHGLCPIHRRTFTSKFI